MTSQYSFGSAQKSDRVAGDFGQAPERGTKACPRCGARLFEDMDVCYGCLYDFRNPGDGFVGLPDPGSGEVPARSQPAPAPGAGGGGPAPGEFAVTRAQPAPAVDDPGATLAFGSPGERTPVLRVSSPSVEVSVPVGEGGVSFGRSPDNDVVLPARTASREHLRVVVRGGEVMAFDQGATNPATLNGTPVSGGVRLAEGDVVEMGDVSVRLCFVG